MRRNLIAVLLCVAAISSIDVQAIDRKYLEEYDLKAASMNTAAKENSISFYRNNQIILMKPDPKGKNAKPIPYTSTIKPNGDLSKPKKSKELGKLGLSGIIAYDSINGVLYFSKYNSLEKDYALYQCLANKGKWQEATQMKIEGTGGERGKNSFMLTAGWNYKVKGLTGFRNPSIAKNGNRIYFTSRIRKREYGNVGSTDIWYIDKKEDGTWSKPQNLGRGVNSTGKEDYAYCVGDTVLYYSSTGKGGMDLYKSYFLNGEWIRGQKLEKPFNSGYNDFNLIANDKNMFLVSNRNTKGKDDIYLFRKKPDPILVPPPVPIPPEPEPDPIIEMKKEWNFVLFYFDFDKDILTPEFLAQFAELVSEMKQFPGETFEIAGHTDQRGSDKYNQRLSERRAAFVRKMLIEEGFPADNLITKAFGEKMPVIEDPKSEDDFQQNRRVEVRIIPKKITGKTDSLTVEPKETTAETEQK